jgi:hypothetical protein
MDTSLSKLLCLKRFRAEVAVGAVSAGSIVVHFDVLVYRLPHECSAQAAFARKVFALPATDSQETPTATVSKQAGFSLHAEVGAGPGRMNARSWNGCAATLPYMDVGYLDA